MKYPGSESAKREFKQHLPKSDQIIKTVIAFCNMHGGQLIIGVNNDREIIGIPEKEAHEAIEWLSHSIYSASAPPILPQVYLQNIHGKFLIVIDVSSGMQKPYYIKSLGLEKGTYIRLGRSTMKADADIIEELKLQARGKSYDHTPVHHASREDLDFNKIEKFIKERRNSKKANITDDLLKAYEILVEQHATYYPSISGLLMFGKETQRFITEAYVLCSHFSGLKGREAIASQVCKGTIIEQFDAAYDFITNRLHKAYSIKEKRRDEKLEIPAIAIREALMNALLHRNYHIKSPVKIAIYDDRIEVFSPGVFPGPIDTDHLESGITYTRNVALAKILWEFQYIEKMGSGFIAIFDSYREANLARPEIIEGTNFVKCILYRKRHPQVVDDEGRVLVLLQRIDEISRSTIVEQLQIPKTSAGRILSNLMKSGKIKRVGRGRNTRYILSS